MNLSEACTALGASRSGYHAHLRKNERSRRRQDEALAAALREEFAASRQTCGPPRPVITLRERRMHHGKNRVRRSMRQKRRFTRHHPEYEPCRQLLRQRSHGIVPGHTEGRMLRSPHPGHTGAGTSHDLRLYRNLLQSSAQAQRPGLPLSGKLRTITPEQLTLLSTYSFSKKDHISRGRWIWH